MTGAAPSAPSGAANPYAAAERIIVGAVTALFVPGNRPDRFVKARGSGADFIIIDLEDAVDNDDKNAALAATVAYLALVGGQAGEQMGEQMGEQVGEQTAVPVLVRINSLDTARGRDDVAALHEHAGALGGIVVPKVESVSHLNEVAIKLPQVPLVAIVETAAGIVALPQLLSTTHISRLAFGAIDFALDVGSTAGAVLDAARSTIVMASRAAALPAPLDSPSTHILETETVAASAASAHAFGFGGMLAIHPAQLDPIRSGFLPTGAELAWARRALAAGGNASQLDGQMVDRPVLERARRLLQAAGERP